MGKAAEKPLVSIITVNYNGLAYLAPLFNSLRKVTYPSLEIIMVDNASTDNSVAYTRTYFPEVKIVENKENYMFARGNNEGIQAAQGEIICLLNNDVVVDPGFIEPVVEAFMADEELSICQPKVLTLDQPEQFEYAGAAGGFIDRYGYPFLRGRLFFTLEEDEGQYDTDIDLFWASGAAFFVRKSVLESSGGLDENFVMHMEEIDLCWRTRLLDGKIRCITAARIWHKGGGTLAAENPRKVYWNYRNNIFLLVKNLSFVNLIKILTTRLFLDLLAFGGEVFKGNIGSALAILEAYSWVLVHWPKIWRERREVQKIRLVSDARIFRRVYPGSIVWEYFARGRKKFSELKRNDALLR